MHVPDGIVPAWVAITGYAAAGGTTWFSLDRIKRKYENPREMIPTASLLTAVFFVASLIHIPMPPTSVHLVLSGLMGVVLGWYAFPAILIGLFFQAVMFQHGGLTTLGLNACIMGLPALLAFGIFRLRYLRGGDKPGPSMIFGFLAGFSGLVLGALMSSLILILTIPANLDVSVERAAILSLLVAHIPLALLEGVFTALVVLFMLRVKPGLLEAELK
ncbi:MAG: cobalt transporter CbiM [Actinobacteria bacterium]|nr:cobalt transporter CbiM [Actinomycetota bacterium]